ncbi:hypothetical protein HYX18_03130 [Candidatus Woesearchaeota archaeon]|nr:hypothetical protein [Candidatus Woesearchaeota archaeon]
MENFSLRAKRAIKKVSAIGMSAGMLLGTLSGAYAATLGDYPAPFVSGGKFQNVALIIGDASTNDDNIAITDVTAGLQRAATGTTTSTTTITSGVEEKIPTGTSVTAAGQLDNILDDGDISYLLDSEITWRSNQYDISENVLLSAQDNQTAFHTSISSSEDDYKDSIRLEIPRGGLQYFYAFDEAINLSDSANPVNTNNPLELKFLGKQLKITNIGSATQFTATIGDPYFLTAGQSVVVAGKTVKLLNVASGTSPTTISVEVDGVQGTVSGTNTKTVNGIEIQLQDTFYSDTVAERSANVVIGKTATKTYKDGDPYIGEPDVNPNWKWIVQRITSNTGTTFANNASDGVTPAGVSLGIKNYFLKDSASRGALQKGECISLPNNFVSVCYDRLTIADDKYMDLKIEASTSTYDLSPAGQGLGSSVPAVYISTPTSEGFVLDTDNDGQTQAWSGRNITAEKKTREIYLFADATNAKYNATMVFYYDNDIKDVVYAGNLSNNGAAGGWLGTGQVVKFAHVNFDNTKDEDVQLLATIGNFSNAGTGTPLNVTVRAREPTDFTASENLTVPIGFGATNLRVARIGPTAGGSSAEGLDLVYTFQTSATQLGAKDEDHRTRYGITIKNPTSAGSSDRMELKVPGDLLQGIIKVGGTSGTAGGTVSSVAPTVKKASEVTTLNSFNAILVGGPCVNSHTAALKGKTYPACGTDSGFTPDTAIIELQQNGANMALIVAGWEAADTKRAGVVLKYWDDATIKTKVAGKSAVTVTGTSLDLTGITVA